MKINNLDDMREVGKRILELGPKYVLMKGGHLEGDAVDQLQNVEGEFDMIFLDAAKGQYKLFYDLVIDKLKVGGVLISDNILYKGMIASDDLVVRRKKTIVKRMRDYLDYICNCDYLTTSLLPMGDGVAISYKDSKRGENKDA